MLDEKKALLEKLIQNKLENLPRAIEGDAPMINLKKICRELALLKEIKEIVETNGSIA